MPRHYLSVSLLGEKGITTPLDKKEYKKCYQIWEKSELWPKRREEEPSIIGTETSKIYNNFCPEVVFEIFGIFAINLSEYADELDRNIAHKELSKVKAGKDDYRWYWPSMKSQHYTDCPVYSLLINYSMNKEKTDINLTSKQEKDYEKFEYKCYDHLHIPGTSSINRSNEIIVNEVKIKIGDSLFLLLLRFIVELKKEAGGWINSYTLYEEKVIPDPNKYQKYSNLKRDLQGSLLNRDAEKFIQNDGSRNFRISTHPDFITYNKEKLLNHQDSQIRKLAEELSNNDNK